MSNTVALRSVLFALLATGLGLIYAGIQLRYYGRTGPGPGFFPTWIGILLSLAAGWALFRSFFDEVDPRPFIESREAVFRVGTVLSGLFVTWLLLEYLGFRLAVLLFVLFVPRVLGQQSFVVVVVTALIMSFGVAYAFETWLTVFLPRSSIEALSALGL